MSRWTAVELRQVEAILDEGERNGVRTRSIDDWTRIQVTHFPTRPVSGVKRKINEMAKKRAEGGSVEAGNKWVMWTDEESQRLKNEFKKCDKKLLKAEKVKLLESQFPGRTVKSMCSHMRLKHLAVYEGQPKIVKRLAVINQLPNEGTSISVQTVEDTPAAPVGPNHLMALRPRTGKAATRFPTTPPIPGRMRQSTAPPVDRRISILTPPIVRRSRLSTSPPPERRLGLTTPPSQSQTTSISEARMPTEMAQISVVDVERCVDVKKEFNKFLNILSAPKQAKPKRLL
uniref:Myb_DNA-bind_5 domain-containing protein n=1 Tax=Rhabditophanes sp. KR3021 TaxID=114890 RepID=A0AC35U004_9BILA